MEIEDVNQETQEVSTISQLHKVTSLSKYLAMFLFIVLPFIGGWIGYSYAPAEVMVTLPILEKPRTAC